MFMDAYTKVLKVIETMFKDCDDQELYKKLEKIHKFSNKLVDELVDETFSNMSFFGSKF